MRKSQFTKPNFEFIEQKTIILEHILGGLFHYTLSQKKNHQLHLLRRQMHCPLFRLFFIISGLCRSTIVISNLQVLSEVINRSQTSNLFLLNRTEIYPCDCNMVQIELAWQSSHR